VAYRSAARYTATATTNPIARCTVGRPMVVSTKVVIHGS